MDIYPVMLDDDGHYQCQVGPGPVGQPGVRSRFATLTVLTAPEPPRIVQGDYLLTTEDREIELECISQAGRPAAEVIVKVYIHYGYIIIILFSTQIQ